jgi:hypothetical protein
MPEIETYVACRGKALDAGPERAMLAAVAALSAAEAAYTISVRFLGGLSASQKAAFTAAANRWTAVITGALPPATVNGERLEGLVILAQGRAIDGPGRVLGQAGPTFLRPNTGVGRKLPIMGKMTFDSADLAAMEERGTLHDVITHEMGHVIGVGTIWSEFGLIADAGTHNPTFVGANAQREYGALRGGAPLVVPVENEGGPGTADGHWRDAVFGNELMTGFVADAGNPLSRLTSASLADMGYGVDMAKADPYGLPAFEALAAMGALSVSAREDHLLGTLPMILPPESLN